MLEESAEIFQQFLQFLYTGQLLKPASKELGMVAEKYHVEALMALCQAAEANEMAIHKGLLTVLASSKTATKMANNWDWRREGRQHKVFNYFSLINIIFYTHIYGSFIFIYFSCSDQGNSAPEVKMMFTYCIIVPNADEKIGKDPQRIQYTKDLAIKSPLPESVSI